MCAIFPFEMLWWCYIWGKKLAFGQWFGLFELKLGGVRGGEGCGVGGAGSRLVLAICLSSGSEERAQRHHLQLNLAGGVAPFLDPSRLGCAWSAEDTPTDDPVGFLEPSFCDMWWELSSLWIKKIFLSLVDLQCCVNFKCTAKWFIYVHTYIIYIFWFFSLVGYYKILSIVPISYSRSLLATSFIYRISINPKFLIYPLILIPPLVTMFISHICQSVSVLHIISFVLLF